MSPLTSVLYDICPEEGDTASIEFVRNLASQKIQKGEVKSIVSSSINGKSVNFNVSQTNLVFSVALQPRDSLRTRAVAQRQPERSLSNTFIILLKLFKVGWNVF